MQVQRHFGNVKSNALTLGKQNSFQNIQEQLVAALFGVLKVGTLFQSDTHKA